MREVKLYGLTKSIHCIAGDSLRYQTLGNSAPLILPTGELATPITDVKVDELPVHHIRFCDHYGHNIDEFIAIDPALRDMLEVPFREQLRYVRDDLDFQMERIGKLNKRLITFNSQPWHKRIWRALTREL